MKTQYHDELYESDCKKMRDSKSIKSNVFVLQQELENQKEGNAALREAFMKQVSLNNALSLQLAEEKRKNMELKTQNNELAQKLSRKSWIKQQQRDLHIIKAKTKQKSSNSEKKSDNSRCCLIF